MIICSSRMGAYSRVGAYSKGGAFLRGGNLRIYGSMKLVTLYKKYPSKLLQYVTRVTENVKGLRGSFYVCMLSFLVYDVIALNLQAFNQERSKISLSQLSLLVCFSAACTIHVLSNNVHDQLYSNRHIGIGLVFFFALSHHLADIQT